MNIRKARKKAGLTQEALAQRIGVNRATISKYESGLIAPTIQQINEIASALGVSEIELLSGMSDQEREEQFKKEWAEYESANKGRLFFNFLAQNPLLINILSSAYVDLRMDKEGRIIATYEEYEEKEIFLGDLEKLQELLSESIMKCVKESIGLPLDEESATEPPETPTEGNTPTA